MLPTETLDTSHTSQKGSPRGLKIIAEASKLQDQAVIQPTNSGSTNSPAKHEDLWTCRHCGWTYPNAHPSAKHRRNHKKHCGERKIAKERSKSLSNTSNDSSSEDEGHIGSEHDNHEPVVQNVEDNLSEQDSHLISRGITHVEGDIIAGIKALPAEDSPKVLNGSLSVRPQDHIEPANPIEEITSTVEAFERKSTNHQTSLEEPILHLDSNIEREDNKIKVSKSGSNLGQDSKSETGDESLPSHPTSGDQHDGVIDDLTTTETLEHARSDHPVQINSVFTVTDNQEHAASKEQAGGLAGNGLKESLPEEHQGIISSSEENQGIISSPATTAIIGEYIGCDKSGDEVPPESEGGTEAKEGFEHESDEAIKCDLPTREAQLQEKTVSETRDEISLSGPKEDSCMEEKDIKTEESFPSTNLGSEDIKNIESAPVAVHPFQTSEKSFRDSDQILQPKDNAESHISRDGSTFFVESSESKPFEEVQTPELWEQLLDAELERSKPKELGDSASLEVLPSKINEVQESELDVSRPKPTEIKPEDTWTCRRCGWKYPNPHPSAKHRRNHKKHCGKQKGFEVDAAVEHTQGSSEDASSDDEVHPKQENSLPNLQQDDFHKVQPMVPSAGFVSSGENSRSEIVGEPEKNHELKHSFIQNTEISVQSGDSNSNTHLASHIPDKTSDTGTSNLKDSHLAVSESSQAPEELQFSSNVKAEPKQLPSAHVSPLEAEKAIGVDHFDGNDKHRPSLQVLFSEDLKVNKDQAEQEGIPQYADRSSPSSKGTPFVKRVLSKVRSAPPDISATLGKEKTKMKPKWGVFVCCSAAN